MLPNRMLNQHLPAVSSAREQFFLLQCSARGAKLFKHFHTQDSDARLLVWGVLWGCYFTMLGKIAPLATTRTPTSSISSRDTRDKSGQPSKHKRRGVPSPSDRSGQVGTEISISPGAE